jgi:hypothetical protein
MKTWIFQDVENVGGPMLIVITWLKSRTNEVVFERLPGAAHKLPCQDRECPKNRVGEIVTDLWGYFPDPFECRELVGLSTDQAPRFI